MATTSKRVLWKGAISFGLVHIPIALHSATEEQGLDFDWLDKRSMDPVGYKRINKKTGKDITQADIVKGLKVEDGVYVVLTPEEIKSAYPKTTQTIEIEAFVPAGDIPFVYMERPYYISPINKGAKVYALLREILQRSGKVGVAKVVIQTKQHLAVLIPSGPALVLNLLRWGDEIRTWDELNLPPAGIKAAGLSEKEMKMGEQLVEDMSGPWIPADFTDSFKQQILALVEEKVKAGKTENVAPLEAEVGEEAGAKIYDLTEMLQRSLNQGAAKKPATAAKVAKPAVRPRTKPAAKAAPGTAAKPAAKKTAAKRKAA
jgi:DNA end-binding protein Ku